MTRNGDKVGGCKLGNLVHDYALGRHGIVVGGPWTEERVNTYALDWEWEVLYDDGELLGADTMDLVVIDESR